MSEILIKAFDNTHSDPIKDQRGCYKKGMPVVVMEDGHIWGSSEGLPNFYVLKLPGISVDRVRHFINPETEDGGIDERGHPIVNTVRRRTWRIFIEDLPQGAINKLNTEGYITIANTGGDYTWTQVRNYIKKITTNELAAANL
jgi:hypothetical protein